MALFVDKLTRKADMYRDNPRAMQPGSLSPQTLYRGLYVRVSQKLRVDPSFVSRVARGERHSQPVESALRNEIDQINKKVGGDHLSVTRKSSPDADSRKRLRFFISRNDEWLRKQWTQESQADPGLKRIPVHNRLAPIPPLVQEAVRVMKYSVKEMPHLRLKASVQHGRIRHGQGSSVETVLEDYNLIRRCFFMLAEENMHHLVTSLLIHDLAQLGEVLDLQSQSAVKEFLAQA
ncbi:MAG: hypothetical protein M3O09_08485 [Acidobacteriota bacterium]|nr:hypothetical protein [Acidobacteriota bacterium]